MWQLCSKFHVPQMLFSSLGIYCWWKAHCLCFYYDSHIRKKYDVDLKLRNYQCNSRNCKDIPGCCKLHVAWINFTRYYEPLVFDMKVVSTMSCYPLETQHPFIKKMGYKRSISYWKVGGCNRKCNVIRLV